MRETVDATLIEQVTLALVGIGSMRPSKLLASSGNVVLRGGARTLQ